MIEGDGEEGSTSTEPAIEVDDDDLVGYNDLVSQFPKDEPFVSVEPLNDTTTTPEWHMKLSYCKDMDTRRACFMNLLGPKMKRTITVTYECCHGYELDQKKEKCERSKAQKISEFKCLSS